MYQDISHSAIELLKSRTVSNGDRVEIQLDHGLVAALLKMIFTDVIWWKMKLVESQINEVDAAMDNVKSIVKVRRYEHYYFKGLFNRLYYMKIRRYYDNYENTRPLSFSRGSLNFSI